MEFENVLKVLSKYNNTYFYVHDFSLSDIKYVEGFIEALNCTHSISDKDYFACRREIFHAKKQWLY
jgi:hypothetical protein